MDKVKKPLDIIKKIQTGHTIMVGGFGLVGAPLTLIDELIKHDAFELTVISNNLGEPGKGLGLLLRQGKIKKAIGSYFTSNREVGDFYNQGKLEIQLMPQGTMAESIRAGGSGIGGYYTKTGAGTELANGKEAREIDGQLYVLETPLRANVAIIKAYKADRLGNLVYYKTARNFNPIMAAAADYCIVEADIIVEPGQLSPEEIVTPHLYVDAIVESALVLSKEGVMSR